VTGGRATFYARGLVLIGGLEPIGEAAMNEFRYIVVVSAATRHDADEIINGAVRFAGPAMWALASSSEPHRPGTHQRN
jgi:hypothetical protein